MKKVSTTGRARAHLLGIGLLLSAVTPVLALQPYNGVQDIDAATAVITNNNPQPIPTIVTAGGNQHGNRTEGNGSPVFKDTQGGSTALAFKANASTAVKDRTELELVSIPLGVGRYTRFRIFVPDLKPAGWLIFAQWHRSGPSGVDSPPVALELERNTNNLLVNIRNSNSPGGVGNIVVNGTTYFARTNLPRNTWHDIVVWTRFYDFPSTASRFVVFLGPNKIADYTGVIGYNQAGYSSFYHKVGNYRQGSAQPFWIYLDDIRSGLLTF